MKRPTMRIAILAALAALAAAACPAQEPDRRGEVALEAPSYRGRDADAPIPPEMHVRNEGGSDGAGLCVISSLIINGQWQRIPGLTIGKRSDLWRTAKSRPGGYSPEKLEALLAEVMPGEKYASYVGTDPAVLEALTRAGYPVGVTMNTGALYGYRPIHHMVSLIHFRIGGYACVVDNNDPGKYHWMPADEFVRRWYDGGVGWAFHWTRLAPRAGLGAVLIASAALILIASARRRAADDKPDSLEELYP